MNRICLFAGFHPKNQISDYVVYYVRALCELADVYYLADCEMPASELAKLAPYTKGAWGQRHGSHDFGSWKILIDRIGWETIRSYDECIFVNDSVFAPLTCLKSFVEKGSSQPVDAWALNAYEYQYLEVYCYVLKKSVLASPIFETFVQNITKQNSINDVIIKYEHGLTKMLRAGKFTYKVFASFYGSAADEWRQCIKMGLPILKTKVLTKYRIYVEHEWLPGWRKFVKKQTAYPLKLIDQHLVSMGVDPHQFDTLYFRLKSCLWTVKRWRRKLLRIHFSKDVKIVVLFGITIVNTDIHRTCYPVETFK